MRSVPHFTNCVYLLCIYCWMWSYYWNFSNCLNNVLYSLSSFSDPGPSPGSHTAFRPQDTLGSVFLWLLLHWYFWEYKPIALQITSQFNLWNMDVSKSAIPNMYHAGHVPESPGNLVRVQRATLVSSYLLQWAGPPCALCELSGLLC